MEEIDSAFNKVDGFVDLCELIKDPLSDRSKIMLSYKTISKHNVFMDSLKTWNRKPLPAKTYSNMKTFFRAEYSGLTLSNSVLSHVDILQGLKNHQEAMAVQTEQNLKINMIGIITGLCERMSDE